MERHHHDLVADDVAVDGRVEIRHLRAGGQRVQLRVQRVELDRVVMSLRHGRAR